MSELIRNAGADAHSLAQQLAELVRGSPLPVAHWEEVVERLREILVDKAEESAG